MSALVTAQSIAEAWNNRDPREPWTSGTVLAGMSSESLQALAADLEPDAPEHLLPLTFEVMATLWLLDRVVAGDEDPVLPDDQVAEVAETFAFSVNAYWLASLGVAEIEDRNVPLWADGGIRVRLAPGVTVDVGNDGSVQVKP